MIRILTTILFVVMATTVQAQEVAHKGSPVRSVIGGTTENIPNPVLPRVADAGVMKYNGKYYIGGVNTYGDFYVSDDLVHWGEPVHVVTMSNEWTAGTGAGNNQIHANDIVYLNGDFHLYWSVNYWGKDRHAVHMVHAVSDNPLGPYTEPEKRHWLDNRIDPKLFRDDDGKLYMYMVRFTDGNVIWARTMSDPATFSSDPICLFPSLPDTWERMDNRVIEGPWVMKYRDRYYMMYNANHTSTKWGNYQLGVAEADSPLGFQNGNKYSYPVVGGNQTTLEENHTDVLRYYENGYHPFFSYTTQTPKAGWNTSVDFADNATWQEGPTGFSSEEIKGSTTRAQGTVWNTDRLWVRKTFTFDKQPGNLALRVAHDGDTRIFLNGKLIYEKNGKDYCIVNLDKNINKLLKKGDNLLAAESGKGHSHFFNVALFDMEDQHADDILITPGQPNILRGPNGFEWWLIYMANKNATPRGQYINRVHFFDKTMYVEGITSTNTTGYHPQPAAPSFACLEECASLGVLDQLTPATAYLFESSVKTTTDAGIYAWWKDAKNYAQVGLDATRQAWYLRTSLAGDVQTCHFPLPADFRWGVYHELRIERDGASLKVSIDQLPAPGQSVFEDLLPREAAGVPGQYAADDKTLFAGTIHTIGFDRDSINVAVGQTQLTGTPAADYEYSYQHSALQHGSSAGTYPIYVDEKNYVKALFDSNTNSLKVIAVKKGKEIWTKDYSLSKRHTHYPDVKYTDSMEKCYRFDSRTTISGLSLSRHDADHHEQFVDDMFKRLDIDYQTDGEWHTLPATHIATPHHPAYNHIAFAPVQADAVRFINSKADDLERHIYKIEVDEVWKDSYNLRVVRRADKLYLFVDGELLDNCSVNYPASIIGFAQDNQHATTFRGLTYYHIGQK